MSIEKLNGGTYFVPTCDVCGWELEASDDFYDAVNSKKAAGWKSENFGGEWVDYCCDCQKVEA